MTGDDYGSLETRMREELAPEIQVVRPLGRGSMATVYLAREPSLKRLVAVKILLEELARDEVARKRFEREAQASASINHPNVVSVFRVGRLSDDIPYILMQYIKGKSLAERLRAEGRLDQAEVCRILKAVAGALEAAHRQGIVHRDVKPGNVLYEKRSGRIYLTDFGIAAILASGEGDGTRLTATGEVLGEPEYLSPEQVRSEEVTEHSDVYSLGVTGFELLTGRLPFEGGSSFDVATAHIEEEPPRASEVMEGVNGELDDLLHRCLAKNPWHRPEAEDVVRRLERLEGKLGRQEKAAAPAGREARARGAAGRGGGAPGRASEAPAASAASGTAASGEAEEEGFLARLKERKIYQVGIGFGGGGYAVVEGISTMVEMEVLPPLAFELCLVFWLAGIPASLTVAWFHGEEGEQKVRPAEIWILGVIAVGWLVATAMVVAG